jgi:transcriptional regulator with XRE-family HTH domain
MSIGEALAEARRQAGLTVTQVSERTRIREAIIGDIERDDYAACGGDFYARGHIRSIARAVGADPVPLVAQYDEATEGPTDEFPAVVIPEPVTRAAPVPPAPPAGMSRRRRLNWALALASGLVIAIGVMGYYLVSGSQHGPAATAALAAGTAAPAHRHPAHRKPRSAPAISPTPAASARPAAPAHPLIRLIPAGESAFGPGGTAQGDNPQSVSLAIDGSPATAWHSDWYTTALFGGLQSGTGLLLDMGRPVTITAVQVTLGSIPGADVQVRAGDVPSLAALRPVTGAAGTGGLVRLHLAAPAHGRYVLLWFTRLPPDTAGTFQAEVYDIRLEGSQ